MKGFHCFCQWPPAIWIKHRFYLKFSQRCRDDGLECVVLNHQWSGTQAQLSLSGREGWREEEGKRSKRRKEERKRSKLGRGERGMNRGWWVREGWGSDSQREGGGWRERNERVREGYEAQKSDGNQEWGIQGGAAINKGRAEKRTMFSVSVKELTK